MIRNLSVATSFVCAGALLLGCSGGDGSTGPAGPAGPEGQDGQDGQDGTGTPSISAVIPNQAFLARTMDVTISGYGTAWDGDTTVDFGSGVTVNELTVASPTALVANITVESSADMGVRDVNVSGAGDPLVYAQAFAVDSPIGGVSLEGSAAEGSILFADIQNIDVAHPFDTTTEGDGFFTPLTFPNMDFVSAPGISHELNGVSSYSLQLLLLVDVGVPAGDKRIDVVSGPSDNQTHFPHPSAFGLEARTPTAISLGQDTIDSVAGAYESAVFSLDTGAGAKMVDLSVSAASGAPQFALLPESGSFQEMISWGSAGQILSGDVAETYYLVFWDNSGESGYDFTISSTYLDIADTLIEAEPNNDTGNAQIASGVPVLFSSAQIDTLGDEDWIAITAAAGDVGSQVHVVTMPGDGYCDTVVEVLEGDGSTSLGGESVNSNYHENHLSAAIPAAGTYYVKISADQTGYYDPSYPNYEALITIE